MICENIDVYPLLSVSDILVTDYSSVIFDYHYLKKPIIIHAPDILEYKQNNRDLYLEVCDVFSPSSQTIDELLSQIKEYVLNKQASEVSFATQGFELVGADGDDFGRDCLLNIRNYLKVH